MYCLSNCPGCASCETTDLRCACGAECEPRSLVCASCAGRCEECGEALELDGACPACAAMDVDAILSADREGAAIVASKHAASIEVQMAADVLAAQLPVAA